MLAGNRASGMYYSYSSSRLKLEYPLYLELFTFNMFVNYYVHCNSKEPHYIYSSIYYSE
jgi:hypothetical protein